MVVADQRQNFPADVRQRAYCGDISLALSLFLSLSVSVL